MAKNQKQVQLTALRVVSAQTIDSNETGRVCVVEANTYKPVYAVATGAVIRRLREDNATRAKETIFTFDVDDKGVIVGYTTRPENEKLASERIERATMLQTGTVVSQQTKFVILVPIASEANKEKQRFSVFARKNVDGKTETELLRLANLQGSMVRNDVLQSNELNPSWYVSSVREREGELRYWLEPMS